jgi:hypothetical protein
MNKSGYLSANLLLLLGSIMASDLCHAESNQLVNVATVDPLGPRYESTLEEGIQFAKAGYPSFLQSVSGVSGYEPWGRWTEGKEVVFKFKKKLPKKFTLELTAQAFGPNVNEPLTVKLGKITKGVTLTSDRPKVYMVQLSGVDTDALILLPAKPTTPKSMGVNEDLRSLGIGLVKLKIK